MSHKAKGSRAERELIHMLHEAGWGIIRSAGSGSTPLPSTDIITGNGKRYLAIECKATKYPAKYFYPDEIDQLTTFSSRFGAEPWLGLRFNNQQWYFVQPKDLVKSKNGNLNMSLELIKEVGKTFEQLTRGETTHAF